MKNQIQQVAEQAKKSVPHGLAVDKWIEVYNEKFAELIVEECFKAAMIESKGRMNPIDLIKRMKERVGVEE